MPVLSTRKNCKWCQAVKADPKLLKRLYKSRKYTGRGESLRQIATDLKMQYPSLVHHCNYHQGLTDDAINTAKVEAIARKTSNQLIQNNVASTSARQSVVDALVQVTSSDEYAAIPPEKKVALLLKALKDTDDVKAKQKDQEIDIVRMMSGIRSGEVKPTVEGKVIEAEYTEFNPWDLGAAGALEAVEANAS